MYNNNNNLPKHVLKKKERKSTRSSYCAVLHLFLQVATFPTPSEQKKNSCFLPPSSPLRPSPFKMAAARRLKRVAVSQPGFLGLKSNVKPSELVSSRRKRVNKNKKKNWNRHSDIHDVEDFLEDIRHQERTTGWVCVSVEQEVSLCRRVRFICTESTWFLANLRSNFPVCFY